MPPTLPSGAFGAGRHLLRAEVDPLWSVLVSPAMPPKRAAPKRSKGPAATEAELAPRNRKKQKTPAVVPAPVVGEQASEESLADETSDSECEYDAANRQIGRNAAREVLGVRSRKQYTTYQDAMVSWGQQQNAALPAEKRYKTRVPFSYRFVANYLDYLKQKEIPWPYKPGFTKHYSTDLLLSVIVAIKDAYRIEEVSIQEEIENLMNNFYKMYCKFIGREKMLGRYPVQVGRSAIPISAFKMISTKLFEMQNGGNWKPQIQVWPYWNILGTILSRCERVGDVLVEHIAGKEDMILFDVSTSKTDPTGSLSYAKCIASNPYEPHSDAFLGLAFLFFCRNSESDNRIFSYADMPATATIYLHKILDALTEHEETVLCCSKNLVGLHTAKKTGCSKLYDNECTVAVAIEKRCDHNLHGSQGSYVGDLPANDAFNARILAGLEFGTDEFAAKPCHFDGVPDDVWLSIPWNSIIQGYSKFPVSCKGAMPLLLASVIHHEAFIRNHLRGGGGHPILFSPLFTIHKTLFDKLKPYVRYGLCQSEMTTTGVPLSSKTHATVHRIERRLANIEAAMQRLNVLPAEFQDTASSACPGELLVAKLDKVLDALAALTNSGARSEVLVSKATTPVWSIGYLPSDFRIAPMSVAELWRAWHVATASAPALKGVCGKMLPVSDNRVNDIRQLSRYSKVVEFIAGTTKVLGTNVEVCFDLLWNQCQELAGKEGIALGSVNQGAGTFYNAVCAQQTLKLVLLSPNRIVLIVPAENDATQNVGNGVFFEAARMYRSAQHTSTVPAAHASPSIASFPLPLAPAPGTQLNATVPIAMRSPIQIAGAAATHKQFLFPVGITTELCWNRWHDFHNPLRNIAKLPASFTAMERINEGTRWRKIKGVMAILQGQTTDTTVDLDPIYVWNKCWHRCVTLFQFEEKRARGWAAGSLYDHLHKQPERVKEARAAPSITFSQFAERAVDDRHIHTRLGHDEEANAAAAAAPQTPNLQPHTPNPKPRTPNPKPLISNPKTQTPNPKPQTSTPNPKPQPQPPNCKPQT